MQGFRKKTHVMGKFDLYKINLKGVQQENQEREFLLDNRFFTDVDGEDIQKGNVKVSLAITKVNDDTFNFEFQLNGTIVVSCDRCLDDMNFPIETTARLIVKFGDEYSEESDEIVIIPEKEGNINIAWYLYEFAALTIPIKHVHAPGKCNKDMTSKLKQHSAKNQEDDFDLEEMDDTMLANDDSEDITDSRWDELKKLKK